MPSRRVVVIRSITVVFSRMSISAWRRIVRIIAASHCSPVMSPAWKMRRALCPPSRVRSQDPSGFFENFTPHRIRSAIPFGASATMRATTRSVQSPAPAICVSFMCDLNESSGAATQQMPPCAKFVLQSASARLVARTTFPCGAR